MTMKENKIWYAVMKDSEDNDWGYGSYDKSEAVDMAKPYLEDGGYIAIIDETNDEAFCIGEIHDF